MGSAGSKAAARSAARASSAVKSSSAEAQAISSAERARDTHLRQLEEQQEQQRPPPEGRDEHLLQSMQALMGSMAERQVSVGGSAEAARRYGWRKRSRAEREAELEGRLDTPALKALFEDRLRGAAAGREVLAAELARRYGARQEVLEQVLAHASVPVIREAADGRLVGSWPGRR